MKAQLIPVKWRDTIYKLNVCYSADKVKELLARWPDGYIDLVNIFTHTSPSSFKARVFIIRYTLSLAKETLDISDENAIEANLIELSKNEAVKVKVNFFEPLQHINKDKLAKIKLQRMVTR